MVLGVAAVFVSVAVSSLFGFETQSKSTCLKTNTSDYVEGRCPVKVTPVPCLDSGGYSENLSIHIWLKDDDLDKSPNIEINVGSKVTIHPFREGEKALFKNQRKGKISVMCPTARLETTTTPSDLWELLHHVHSETGRNISVSYVTASTRCNVRYTIKDPVPEFGLEVNPLSKSFNVTVDLADYPVYARWYYRNGSSNGGKRSFLKQHIPSQSQSAVIAFPFLLPCVCAEVYYNYSDARRNRKCPPMRFVDATDVWLSSTVRVYASRLTWISKCAASEFNISASLCWRQNDQLCTSTLETSLKEEKGGQILNYSTSAWDKHPLMCVQFSLQGSHHVSCPFQADRSSWEVSLGSGGQSVFLFLTSSTPATFSAQLCVLEERMCTPVGEIHSVTLTENTTGRKMKVPVSVVARKPCVQVWRSSPPLTGRRILCPEYTHKRYGLYTVATVMLVFMTAFVVTFLHRLTKRGTTGLLSIQKPALLVCSSEQSAHVSAVCALASILQGELSATVHMALWALGSQTQHGAQAGVADLGPLPWLYGQWEAVSKEQGKVLIVWSSEAKKTYEKWKEERERVNKTELRHDSCRETKVEHEKLQENMVDYSKQKGKRQKDCVQSCEDLQREPCTAIAPVFMAALACLEAALHKCKGQRVAFVYFQSFCRSRDIPKAFRGIPRYCLPQDFRGLLQELGAKPSPTKTGTFGCDCLPRLLSKVMSLWLARRLAQKLQTLLPQMQGRKKPRDASPRKQTLGKRQSGLGLPPTEDTGDAGTSREHQPLCRPPRRAEHMSVQVSCV